MHTLEQSYRGLSLIMTLNWDRLLFLATLAFALSAGAWLASLWRRIIGFTGQAAFGEKPNAAFLGFDIPGHTR